MNIREATLADLDFIEEIYNDIHLAEENGCQTIGWMRGVYPTRKTAEEAILRGDMFVLEDGKVLGAGIINRTQVDVYYGVSWEHDTDLVCVLHTLVISPGAAGRGYGRAFVEFYEWWAKEHNLPELRIDTNARNTVARAMYRKLGYKEIGTVPTTFNGIPGVDLVLLEKNLGILTITDEIKTELYHLQDIKYRDFQSKLIPTVSSDYFIGVRTPELRKLAKQVGKRDDVDTFLNELPHTSFDENQLHAFIISGMKDYAACLEAVDRFLPYVDNWATCDQMSPKVFRKHRKELLESIRRWIESDETYTVRFGIGMLMEHFLDEDFEPEYAQMVAGIRSKEYYVNMMIAWYFATALAKQYEAVLPYIEERKLDTWTHNKTIQKSVESCRISSEQKEYLKSLKVK